MIKLNKVTTIVSLYVLSILPAATASAQAFHKGALLISLSEGRTFTDYSTTNTSTNAVTQGHVNGDRDPLTIEYGVSKCWGIGINMGGDVLPVNPTPYYGFQAYNDKAKVITAELTLDVHYHFLLTHRTDLSAFYSFGRSNVNLQGNNGDTRYQYNAQGGIMRLGAEGRYYFCKHFGVLAMVSAFSSNCSTKDVKGNTVANNYSTGISGCAWELGICFRLLR
jgi:hypothetical protein